MAVREVIHFPFRAQLVAHPELPVLFPPEPVAESPPQLNSRVVSRASVRGLQRELQDRELGLPEVQNDIDNSAGNKHGRTGAKSEVSWLKRRSTKLNAQRDSLSHPSRRTWLSLSSSAKD